MSAELGLAIVAVIGVAIKSAVTIRSLCTSFEHATTEIKERLLRFDLAWTKTTEQMVFLQRIWDLLSEEHQNQQERAIQVLISKFQLTITDLNGVLNKKRSSISVLRKKDVRRTKYVWVKNRLDEAIRDLELWQRTFDPSWFLILKTADNHIDSGLVEGTVRPRSSPLRRAVAVRKTLGPQNVSDTTIFLPKNGLDGGHIENIPFCTARLVFRSSSGGTNNSTRAFIVDSVPCLPDGRPEVVLKDVRYLANELATADPFAFGLLQCHGVVKVTDQPQDSVPRAFDFVYKLPEELKLPESLRKVLLTANKSVSLTARLEIAQQLARSVSFVHLYGFVHKGIRPETILTLRHDTTAQIYTFLLGFERFRLASGHSLREGDRAWEKELYRHPQRQGVRPEQYYCMQHDIYSFGVCLLEIAEPSELLRSLGIMHETRIQEAGLVKTALVHTAKKTLPSRMGDVYAKIVLNCLTCLDEANADFGDQSEFQDADGIAIGVRYIEKVNSTLSWESSSSRLTFADSSSVGCYLYVIADAETMAFDNIRLLLTSDLRRDDWHRFMGLLSVDVAPEYADLEVQREYARLERWREI